MRFVSIASGSSGNCTYIGSENSHILVDAGISCKRITDSLKELDVKPQELNGIFITHEHSDHIQGVRVMAKKYGIPIYGTKNTLQKIREYDKKKEIDEALYCPLQPDILVQVGDLEVNPFSSSHDAVDPVVYRIESGTGENKKAVAVVTDLGVYDQSSDWAGRDFAGSQPRFKNAGDRPLPLLFKEKDYGKLRSFVQ